MNGIKDFFHSEKGIWGFLVPMVGATAMLVQGSVSPDQWMDFAKVLAGIYVGGKSIQGGAKAIADARKTGEASREDLEKLVSRLDQNDSTIDELVAAMDDEKKRYAATPEG